jgi:hypothetical protein
MPSDTIYNHETVLLDGETFDACEFRDCRMVYAGGEPPVFAQCRFDNCDWRFDEVAGNTLTYLKTLWTVGQKATVQGLIKEVTGVAR